MCLANVALSSVSVTRQPGVGLTRYRAVRDPAAPESESPAGMEKVVPESRACVGAVSFDARVVFSGTVAGLAAGPRLRCPGWRGAFLQPHPVGPRRCHIRRPGRGPFLPEQQSGYEDHFCEPDLCDQDLGLSPMVSARLR